MELYIGGFCQGKTEYVQKLYPKGTESEKEIWDDFNVFVKEELKKGKSQEEIKTEVFKRIEKNPEIVIIGTETGSGIVPMEKEERVYREAAGRLLTDVAFRAEKVVRIICGIPQILK